MPITQNDGIVSPTLTFISPDGKPVVAWSLGQLAQQYGLDRRALWAVAKGRRLSHKGWTLVGTQRRRRWKYRLVNDNGQVAEFTSVAEWAEFQGLKAIRVRKLLNSQIKSVAGWRQERNTMGIFGTVKKKQVPCTLYNIDGSSVVIENVAAFAADNGLTRQSVYDLLNGNLKTYAGWATTPDIVNQRIEMVGPNGEYDVIEGNPREFALRHGLDTGNLYKLLNGKAKSVRGWRIAGH